MDESSEGCYCIQAQNCQHWIAATTIRRAAASCQDNAFSMTSYALDEHQDRNYRPIVVELQRELRIAMLEIEKLTQMSRDLACMNQELEESRLVAMSDQARTAKRLLLMSSQLEYTEQKLYNLTQKVDDSQRDSDLLRIERLKREAFQEREDAGRLRIEALQDELQETQRSERMLQQKLTTTQTKYEALSKRHDLLRQKQQELELARESKEALAWLKETTERLCSPPQGSLGEAIKQERYSSSSSSSGTAPISIQTDTLISPSHSPSLSLSTSPASSSPPYPSSLTMDPPLAAQNQLISLIKELATTNSTLRSELNEYRDLLQDSRNEVLMLRSQVEDFEQGIAFQECCGQKMGAALDNFKSNRASWNAAAAAASALEFGPKGAEKTPLGSTTGLDVDSSSPTSAPPPYMTAAATLEQHHHHHIHLPGVRGNIFGELERLYSQNNQLAAANTKNRSHHHHHHHSHHHRSSKRDAGTGKRSSNDHGRSQHGSKHHSHSPSAKMSTSATTTTTTVSTSTSTSENRRANVNTTNTSLNTNTNANTDTNTNANTDTNTNTNDSHANDTNGINANTNANSTSMTSTSKRTTYTSKFDHPESAGSSHRRSKTKRHNTAWKQKSLYTDVDMDMLDSEDEHVQQRGQGRQQSGAQEEEDGEDPGEQFSDSTTESNEEQEPGFVAAFAEALSFLSFFSGPLSGSPP
ncbi:hypothetical protein BGZ94_007525 [Podila epigama]|nr:hypothetical protein BGZ94_007525 [Podila epigama]